MSLKVSPELLEDARSGKVADDAFLKCMSESLPDAWALVSKLAHEREVQGLEYVDNRTVLTDDVAGQLLRMMASDAMRSAIERHFGVRVAFQNCHRVALFRATGDAYNRFTSTEAQLLNQNPELVNC
ncbi:SCO5389 family protein [Nonomuraea typhae]|uniref:SCO5389 family protein n=1 Tax=Nonomuraea typhae TaxID=2603600 RepID=UPI0012FBDB7B|nr:SCO5389 family protein [Nonomuraea typhae]